ILDFFTLFLITLAHDYAVAPATPASLCTAGLALKIFAALTLVIKFPYCGASTDLLLDLFLYHTSYAFNLLTQVAGLLGGYWAQFIGTHHVCAVVTVFHVVFTSPVTRLTIRQ